MDDSSPSSPPLPEMTGSGILVFSAGGDEDDELMAEDFVHVDSDDRNPNPNSDNHNNSDEIVGSDGSGNRGDGEEEEEEDLMKSLTVLSCESTADGGSCNVYLVGTAHVSQAITNFFHTHYTLHITRVC